MTRFLLVIGGIIVVAAGIFVFLGGRQPRPSIPQPTAKLETAPLFSLQDYSGKVVRSADFAGKPLVINSWAAWCPFCGKELADFATIQKEFGDKVSIIAIDRAEPLDVAKKFTDDLGVTNDLIFLLDPTDSFYKSIGTFAMPETIFVDANGNIRSHKRGPMEAPEIRQRISEILNPNF